MLIDEEEKKKRLERARQLSNSINSGISYSNISNMDSNSEYTNRLNRAKEISNSINPKKTTKTRTLTQEELRQSEENGKYFMDLIDRNVDSNNEENNSSQIVDSSSNVNENANINLTPEQQKEIENKVKEASNVQAPSSKKTEIGIANNQEEKKNWFQANEFQDGYQFGDISKTILGTGTDIVQDLATGILSPIENVFDIGTNVVATVQNILGFKDAAKKTRDFADKNITQNVTSKVANASTVGMLYNLVNGTPEKIFNPAGIAYDEDKNIVENYASGVNQFINNTEEEQGYENSSVLGTNSDQVVELIGYTLGLSGIGGSLSAKTGTKTIGSSKLGANLSGGNIGLRLGGKTLNLPTLAIAGGMAGGLQEANSKENASELERWTKGIISGLTEGVTEGIFGFLGIGGNELTDELGKRIASKFTSKAAKTLTNLGFHASGEAIEEFLSYAGNFFVDNGIIDKLGNADFSYDWNWADVGEQMLLAFLSTTLTGGTAMVVDSNSATKAAEEQLGRKLTQEEKQLVTKAVVDESLNEQIEQMYQSENIPQEFYVSTFNSDGTIASVEQTRGKAIDNPNKKVNVQPAIVRTGNDIYTVIDSETGLRLDTTPYNSTLAAEIGFNKRMINLKERDINAINRKVAMSDYSVRDALLNTAYTIQNDIVQRRNTVQTSQNNNIDIQNNETANYLSQNENAVKTNSDVSQIDTSITPEIIENNSELKQDIQTMATNFLDDLSNSTPGQRYKAGDTWTGQKRSTTKELAAIKDNTGASWNQISQSLEEISNGNITSSLSKKIVTYIDTALTDGYRNIYGQDVLPSENYVNTKKNLGLYKETSQNKDYGVIDDEDVRVFGEKINKRNTNIKLSGNTTQDEEIRNIVKYNPDGREITDENYIDFMVERYKDNKNISGVVTDTKYVISIREKSQNDKINDLFNKIKNKSIQSDKVLKNRNGIKENVHLDVLITKTGLNESFHKSISDEKYAIVPYLDKIIATSQDGIVRDETKNRKDIKGWYYLYNTAEINGKLYSVKVDLKQTQQGDRLYVHRVNLIHKEELPSQAITDKSARDTVGQEVPPRKSIPQNNQTVKNNNIRTEKITTTNEYDSQGNKLTKAQQEFFKDSKVRDKNGNLLVVYHGTNQNGFTEFKRNYNFFTDNEKVAQTYTGNNGIYKGYLKIDNPIKINANNEKWSMIDINNIKIDGISDVKEFLTNAGASIWREKGKLRTSTADIVSAISDAIDDGIFDYDGIIIENIYDEGAYNNQSGAILGTDYITFKSNQFKNITNQKPSSNPDIRYEKIKSTKTSNTKTLIAQHNTSEEKLLEALDLGALPVPSIAITKYKNPILKYGDITLLFNKDTINPTDRRNVTYNSDIYSTRKPEIGIALDKQKLESFEKIATEKGVGYGYLSMIEEYVEQNEFSRARELIQHELEKTNGNVDMQDVEDIYTKLMESVQEKRIMKSGVDPYTPSGNRKSLIQMSIPYTLDNIVKTMTQKSTKGSESNSFAGLAEIRANLAQNFKSIEAMHQNENNLITSEEMDNLKQELNDKFYALVDEIAKHDKVNRYFGSTEVVANALNETAKAKNLSIAILDNELDYVDIKNVPEKTLQKAIDFLNSMKNIPTEYFEAKPQRAVGFNEVQKAIVPQNTSKELIDKLKSKGIPIEYYSTEKQRQQLISNNEGVRFERTKSTQNSRENAPYNEKAQSDDKNFIKNVQNNNYLQKLMSVNNNQGATNAQNSERLIEQQIQYVESMGAFDSNIPVTKLTDIQKTIEDYLGKGIQKGHFREHAYGIYKSKNDTIRVKEYKDIDNILHEVGHALDLGKRLNIDKESISTELLDAVAKHGGYENDTRAIQLEEGFAEIIRTYAINPSQAKIDYPRTVSILDGIRLENKDFDTFITKVQSQIYNYIHQNPRNRVLSNVSIGEQTDKTPINRKTVKENVMRLVYDKDYLLKSTVNEFSKLAGKKPSEITPSRNAYILTRLASGVNNKAISMISDGYIDINGNKLMPGLNRLGEILNNDSQRFNDLRAYLVAKRDLEYKAKTLKTGIRTLDSKAVVEQFQNDPQINEAAQVVYDTLNGVLQYAVNNGLITQDTAAALRESNAFYVPFQRVIGTNGNQIGRRGAVADIIKGRTGSELDIKDVLENIVVNSANIIQQVENNNVLRALYDQGEELGMKNNIFDVIPTPVQHVGTATLSTWENELRKQGVDVDNIDLEKTIDIFAPNNKVDQKNLITSFIDNNGNRVYLQFAKGTDDIFNSIMGLDKNSNSWFLKLMRKLNMPLRYGATMANIGFAIPNMISDTAQATVYSEAGFIPVIDNALGILDVLTATNRTVRNFVNNYSPEYVKRIEYLYNIYQQTGASSSTRLSQYRKSSQEIMKDIYGTKNSETLGIKESFKPLKRLLDIMTYIPELSEQSTRFRVFERNYEAYKNKGGSETDARIKAALESRDATQDFGRTGTAMREINQLIPFSAARVGSAYTFSEKATQNTRKTLTRMALLSVIAMLIKAMGYNDKEIEELNQRKKNDNFVLKIGDTVVTIKKPQGILRSMINLDEYILDLVTGNIEEGKEGEKLAEWLETALMDNLPADEVGGLVPNAIAPVIENSINKDFYYNTDIVKSYDLDLPDSQQYYDYTSQLAIWLGKIFNYSPAKIDNLISGYFGGLGTQVTNVIDYISGKLGLSAEEPAMGAEDNAVGKRFIVNVNENSASIDEVYTLKDELTKKKNGGTITSEESKKLETLTQATSDMAALNKQIRAIKQDLTMSGTEKADKIRPLQEQKTDVARKALGKESIYTTNSDDLDSLQFYPSRDVLSQSGYTLSLTEDMKKEYEELAYSQYKKYEKQGLYSEEYLDKLKSKCKDYAKSKLMQKYRSKLTRTK